MGKMILRDCFECGYQEKVSEKDETSTCPECGGIDWGHREVEIPDVIYLQIVDDYGVGLLEGPTWCDEKIYKYDQKYVLSEKDTG